MHDKKQLQHFLTEDLSEDAVQKLIAEMGSVTEELEYDDDLS